MVIPGPTELTRLWNVVSLFSERRIVSNFSGMERLFPVHHMCRGDMPASELPPGAPLHPSAELRDWIKARRLTSLLVLKDGQVAFEDYFLGTRPLDRRISWSIAKSWLSMLTGILIEEGALPSVDVAVADYAPALAGSAYRHATLRDILMMSSGVRFDEDYLAFFSDINRMGRLLALGGSLDAFTASRNTTTGAPGRQWAYVSTDTHAISMVLRGATGQSIPELMEEKLLRPLRLEASPFYLTDSHGEAFVLGGLNLTTRDYARFGQMVLQDGWWQDRQVVPAAWVRAATRATARTPEGEQGYGYQWWIPRRPRAGEAQAQGIYGQFLYFDRENGVVIVKTAADRQWREPGLEEQNVEMFRHIVDALDRH